MPMITCTDCSKQMSDSASACPNCGKPNVNAPAEKRPVGILLGIGIFFIPLFFSWFTLRKGHTTIAKIISFAWLALSYVIISYMNSSYLSYINHVKNLSSSPAPTWAENLTAPQNNAVRSAKQYLSFDSFSRDGLIRQLSLGAGDGYKVSDATVAVNSLNVDWNKEAVKSAKQYLSFQGFSCKGIIQQLSSSAGDKYTINQATYGARQAGACE